MSDFLEDDGTYHFVSTGSLASPARARQLAAHLREQHGFTLQGVPLCLGHLESIDFAPLAAKRNESVRAYWTTYFVAGSQPTEIQFGGMRILADMECGCVGGKR